MVNTYLRKLYLYVINDIFKRKLEWIQGVKEEHKGATYYLNIKIKGSVIRKVNSKYTQSHTWCNGT